MLSSGRNSKDRQDTSFLLGVKPGTKIKGHLVWLASYNITLKSTTCHIVTIHATVAISRITINDYQICNSIEFTITETK